MISCFNKTTPVRTLLTTWWIASILKASKWRTDRRHLQIQTPYKTYGTPAKCSVSSDSWRHNTARAVVKQLVKNGTGYLLSMLTISSTQCQVDIAKVALRMKDTHTHITDVKPFTKQFTTQWTALHLMVSILFSVFSQFVHYWLCAIFGDSVVFLCWNGRQFLVTTVAFSLIVTPLKINEQWKTHESGAGRFTFPMI